MRILFLLLIPFCSFGQAHFFLGLNTHKEAPTPEAETFYSFVDDDTYGTGNNQVEYSGTWTHNQGKAGSYETSYSFGNTTNGYARMDFTGVGVDVFINKYTTHGIAAISIDGGSETDVDCYGEGVQVLGYSVRGLQDGAHTITVRVKGESNALATGSPQLHWIEIDAFGVVSTVANPPTPVVSDWYVDQSVASSGSGQTLPGAFKTIQEAANVAQPGDLVTIMSGTYRETVTPVNSGNGSARITYQAGEAGVIISGLETVSTSGWTVHSGSIYKKTVTLPVGGNGFNLTLSNNTTLGANQLFKDGTMMIEARWPDAPTPEELFDRTKLRARASTSNWSATSLTDASITGSAWVGGKIWMTGWFIAQSRTINSGSGNTINFNSTNGDLRFSQWYYLTGKLAALSVAKEWFYDPATTTLYFWQNGGGSPTGVEYKARNWGFDLAGKSYISIRGIEMIGCDINGNMSTSNITIDNIRAKYLNHTVLQEGSDVIYYNPRQTGFKLYGANNIVKNSEFKYSASNCIELGQNGRVENNLFEYISYEGNYGAPVLMGGSTADDYEIVNNTMRYIGRSCVDFGYTNAGSHRNGDISYNNMHDFGMLSSDGGAVYGGRGMRLDNTRVHHNWIHNSKAQHAPPPYDIGINAGIYYDQATGSLTTNDHNVLWDNRGTDLHVSTGGSEGYRGKAFFYNNTLTTRVYDNYTYGYFSYLNIVTQYYDVHRNNIYRSSNINVVGTDWNDATNGESPFDVQNCINQSTIPLFVGGNAANPGPINVPNPETYFQLQSGSPARNGGATISGINDGDTGSKDIGAYYYGQTGWTAGYNAVTYVPD